MSTRGITSIKNDSNTFFCSRSYLSVKTCIISKPFNWFAKQINCLVSIQKYLRTDYNIVCVQGNVHRHLVSSSNNHGLKMIFFLPSVQTMCTWMVKCQGKRSGEYQIKYVSRSRTLARISAQMENIKLQLVVLENLS